MNAKLTFSHHIQPQLSTVFTGEITGYDSKRQSWQLDHEYDASCAASLLVKPEVGDKVCFIELDGRYYLVHLLTRSQKNQELVLESSKKVHWIAPRLRFTAFEQLELISLNKLALTGKDYLMSAASTMVVHAEHMIQQLGQYSLTAKGLLKQSAKHQVITAKKDVRIDGERINMG
ncbi:DUF3540 domain-containing protein [Thalassomonas haliotis]|uniref:DUF3540 domain-containing protein n=1 Tax=Thalassomonas haliotis TaxID=485448 RepID=A0ABY7VM24_9GAMM|nr:DUF3540 domain-containing protein [Thalassomonas haliotis]WDE14323.1 DUF3540 domain-containing protein [Thalassomonas haliotis]